MKRYVLFIAVISCCISCNIEKKTIECSLNIKNKPDYRVILLTIKNRTDTSFYFSDILLNGFKFYLNNRDVTDSVQDSRRDLLENQLIKSNFKVYLDSSISKIDIEKETIKRAFINEQFKIICQENNLKDTTNIRLKPILSEAFFDHLVILPKKSNFRYNLEIKILCKPKATMSTYFCLPVFCNDSVGIFKLDNLNIIVHKCSNRKMLGKYYRLNYILQSNTISL